MAWISPTGYNDPDSNWVDENKIYDGNTGTDGYSDDNHKGQWTSYIELTHAAFVCSKIRFYARYAYGAVEQIDIDVYDGSVWHDVYEGIFANLTWVEKTLSEIKNITKARVRLYITGDAVSKSPLSEFEFYQLPTVTTTTPPSAKDHESATLGGNVVDDAGEDITERGFEYKEGEEGEILTVSEEDDDFGEGAYSLEITGLDPYVTYRYRAYAVCDEGTSYGDWESFTTDKTTPTVVTDAVSDILPTTATANGNITSTGGEDCSERGFQYGLTKVATWSVKDDVGGYGAGVFSKGLTDLSANTTYWIRAYAVNSIGTGYSEWLEFQTAAAGIIPTGTKINICSDYSGYTYKLMRSETDDGEAYTAYFVISTDLANKQGLSFYKRILDMDLYFNNEDSGTATISVKRDNETSWVSLGSVSLAGDDDIIIKHLAVDVRAKHFLFKISASNHFEFLGVLFQFIPIGMR